MFSRIVLPMFLLLSIGQVLWAQQGPRPLTLVWVDRSGTEQPLSAPAGLYSNPRISPDGSRLAISIAGPDTEQISICTLPACSNLAQFTSLGNLSDLPVWTPDGRRLAFRSIVQGPPDAAFWQMADGSGTPERLTPPVGPMGQQVRSWSANGQFAAIYRQTPATGGDLWILRMSDMVEFPFLVTPAMEGGPRFAPEGNWLAYMSTASGRGEIYVQELAGARRMRQISTGGGVQPIWNPRGGELFYRSGNRMMAVPITLGANFSVGEPKALFDRQYWQTAVQVTNPNYDVAPDGQRFLMLKE